MSAESPRPNREIAYRLFATEYDDATLSHAESDEERAPNYVITPTGARLNRLFVVGTLTEVSPVNDEMLRARVVDPTGAFVVYAGQYQPDELAALEQLDPPEFVAITGKARTFQPEDSERVYTSVRPESIATVDAETRDRWVASAAEQTIERIDAYAAASGIDARGSGLRDALVEAGVDDPLAQGISLAQGHYGTTPTYLEGLRDRSVAALEVIAGDREDAAEFDARPNETAPDSRSFEEIAAAGTVDIDASSLETHLADSPDAEREPADEPAVSTASASGQESTDEVVGSATGSEPETATLSGESSPTDDEQATHEPIGDEPTDDTLTDDEPAAAQTARDSSTDTDGTDPTADATEVPADAESATESDGRSAVAESQTSGDGSTGEQTTVESDVTTELDEATSASESDGEASSTEISTESDSDDASDGDLGDFDSDGFDEGMYEMDDEEREELEAEFGTEFSTGAEVDEPGSADIDVDSDSVEREEAASEPAEQSEGDESARSDSVESLAEDDQTDADAQSESTTDTEQAAESVDEAAEPDEPIDVQAQVIETMNRLDDGDGADRSTVVSSVVDETGAAPDAVEDAIQDALMGGQCYEPDDETLKAI
ncbi:hypothetical protein [Halostagnicola kamekurae]|uniref:Rpa-associated protein n=1 Tax=Halostagnicola kamekurae TaxID=619731 RepID=A0A1I6UIC2_9EURY|nr:hypothetical protein [Halostagnicola kamekurae]SFT01183.1 hypothetical protein SAMN04488556_3899 [Halostagnicola kamekurae]